MRLNEDEKNMNSRLRAEKFWVTENMKEKVK
jgi:hypothetical protein